MGQHVKIIVFGVGHPLFSSDDGMAPMREVSNGHSAASVVAISPDTREAFLAELAALSNGLWRV